MLFAQLRSGRIGTTGRLLGALRRVGRLPEVAKVLVTVRGENDLLLFSRKQAPGMRKHGRLELLGGHIEPREKPFDGLVRELAEEEASGLLAKRARKLKPKRHEVGLSDAVYHLYRLTIDFDDYVRLEPVLTESMGFVLVPPNALKKRAVHDQLTPKTYELLGLLEMLA